MMSNSSFDLSFIVDEMRVLQYIKFNKVFGVDVTADKAGWWCAALFRTFTQFTVYLANTKTFLWN